LESSNLYAPSTTGVPELDGFVDCGLITHIHAQLTSGKEGTVYCCRAHPSTNRKFVAAKVYRKHAESSYKWDPAYFQGRERVLKAQVIRAVQARTAFGKEVAACLWVEAEYENLRQMATYGVDSPKPVAIAERVILMEYIGNGAGPAPHLNGVDLNRETAERYYDLILDNIEIMLSNHLVHGDLSPYNILVWRDRPWIIDLPQVIDVRFNRNAFELLRRDIANVCGFFEGQGVRSCSPELAADLWDRYQRACL